MTLEEFLKNPDASPELKAFVENAILKAHRIGERVGSEISFGASVKRLGKLIEQPVSFTHMWDWRCFDKLGNLKWSELVPNTTVNVGLDDILDKYWKGSSYTATHYVGLKGTGSIAAGDTMSSHAGWSEVTGYSESVRQTLTLGSVSSQSLSSSSDAAFSINATVTVAGGFITTNSTKGGTTGTLIAVDDFSTSRDVVSGDTLNVSTTLTAASA